MTIFYALYFCGRVLLQNLQRLKYKMILGKVMPNMGLTPFWKNYQNFRNCKKTNTYSNLFLNYFLQHLYALSQCFHNAFWTISTRFFILLSLSVMLIMMTSDLVVKARN